MIYTEWTCRTESIAAANESDISGEKTWWGRAAP